MAKQHKQEGEIIGFHLSAAIPLARVGYVLRELYNGGHDININPVVAPSPVTSNGHIIGPTADVPALSAPTKKRGQRGAVEEAAMAYIRTHDKISRYEFRDAMHTVGYGPDTADMALDRLRGKGLIRRTARATFVLTAKGKTP